MRALKVLRVSFIYIFSFLHDSVGNILPNFVPKEDVASVRVLEGPNTPVGSTIYTFKGEDWDGDSLTFEIKDIRPRGYNIFKIERISKSESNLVLLQELDRESISDFLLEISLTDGRSLKPVLQTMLVIVEDVNDNSPVFKQHNSTLSIHENNRVPKAIAVFKAEDADEGPNGEVTYILETETEDHDTFSLSLGSSEEAILNLLKTLDYEKKSKYKIRIVAHDNPLEGKMKTVETNLIINVTDRDDNSLVFVMTPSYVEVPEDVSSKSEICQVKATYPAEPTQKIVYELLNEKEKFTIEASTGIIKPRMKFVYELYTIHRNYTLNIRASAGEDKREKFKPSLKASVISAETSVVIQILNVEEGPRFKNETYEGIVPENSPSGYPIRLLEGYLPEIFDNDLNGNDLITMSIEGEGGTFQVFPAQGYPPFMFQIVVKDPLRLDFERLREIIFHLIGTDSSGNRTVLRCSIVITDMNDNVPEFENNTYRVRMPENPPIGQKIVQLKATDRDSGYFGVRGLSYSILSGVGLDELEIHDVSGLITVKSPANSSTSNTVFDREVNPEISLNVAVCDNRRNNYCNCKSAIVIIDLEDRNDNAPEFIQMFYQTEILEGTYDTLIPLRILASDVDQAGTPNSEIRFSILPAFQKTQNIMLGISVDVPSGQLRIAETFDFEKLYNVLSNSSFLSPNGASSIVLNFTIQAYDLGTPRLSSFANLTVTILDKNDCPPKFSKYYYEVSIPENIGNGVDILQIDATDLDISPRYNSFTYKYVKDAEGTSMFLLDSNNGVLSLASGDKLDYSQQSNYILEVGAVDELGLQSVKNCVINITVQDVNDKPPFFKSSDHSDTEVEQRYGIYRRQAYYTEVPENTPPDTTVLGVTAADPDSNAKLRYSIQSNKTRATKHGKLVDVASSNYLTINPVTGIIRTGSISFDYESMDELHSVLVVEDVNSETGIQRDYAELTVKVINTNDQVPHFLHDRYDTTISENSAKGTILLQVDATDENGERENIRYSIRSPTLLRKFPFKIDTISGTISIQGSIDRESTEWINFTVSATYEKSKYELSASVPVSVRVMDENDNSPIFLETVQNYSVKENSMLGTLIGSVKATDEDSGSFGTIKYFLDSVSSPKVFTINEDSGIITVTGKLDREKRDLYELTVIAMDNPNDPFSRVSHKILKNFTIHIEDVNDEIPKIHIAPVKNKIVENPVPHVYSITEEFANQCLVNFSVTDGDQPKTKNSLTTTTLIPSNTNVDISSDIPFKLAYELEPNMCIMPSMSLQGKAANYSMRILAEDEGSPKNSATQEIVVIVRNASVPNADDDPSSLQLTKKGVYTALMSPDYEIGRSLLHLQIPNVSFSLGTKIEYMDEGGESVILDNAQNLFLINSLNGTITLNFNASKYTHGYFRFNATFKYNLEEQKNWNESFVEIKIYVIVDDEQRVKLFSKYSIDEAKALSRELKKSLESTLKLIVIVDEDFECRSCADLKDVSLQIEINSIFRVTFLSSEYNRPLSYTQVKQLFQGNIEQVSEIFQKFKILYALKSKKYGDLEIDSAVLYLYYAVLTTLLFMAILILLLTCICVGKMYAHRRREQVEYKEVVVGTAMAADLAKEIVMNLDVDKSGPLESDC